ncbi:sterol 26-hydroxylase, mitochondrial-like [Larimichthys crocea]|uniref:sterol 26-hydroxylase, mitochondrial-like n=1 Tax=Larimichthys crocea TaxID=215358 RepID=UPI000F5E86FB|nr:sterol 26-hydroxylase, mitochondrial-like [Larimichthys crocea]
MAPGSRRVGSDSSAPGQLYTFQDKPQTVEDLPRVSFLELMYRLTFQGFLSRIHELQIYEKQRHGPIYKDALKSVCITTPKLMEEIMRNDDKFPNRGDMSLWQEHRNLRGFGYGQSKANGKIFISFVSIVTLLNKLMLHLKDSAQYGDTLNGVVTDFIKRMYYLRQCIPTGYLVTNMANELYHFSLEAIASILFETRLGCLEKEIPAGTQHFINSISKMFSNNFVVMLLPKWSRGILPYWGRYIEGWDGIFSFSEWQLRYDKKMEFIQKCLDNNEEVKGEYLTYLLSNTQMSTKNVYGNITELLLAGVGTVKKHQTFTSTAT